MNFSITQPTNPYLTPSPPAAPCHCPSTSNGIIIIIIIIINLYLYTKSYHFYMVFLGIVCKIRLKYSKELLDYKIKNTKTYIIMSYNESSTTQATGLHIKLFFVAKLQYEIFAPLPIQSRMIILFSLNILRHAYSANYRSCTSPAVCWRRRCGHEVAITEHSLEFFIHKPEN